MSKKLEAGNLMEYSPRQSRLETEYKEKKGIMLSYMHMKIRESDWHAVADAACDLREIEAKYNALRDNE